MKLGDLGPEAIVTRKVLIISGVVRHIVRFVGRSVPRAYIIFVKVTSLPLGELVLSAAKSFEYSIEQCKSRRRV